MRILLCAALLAMVSISCVSSYHSGEEDTEIFVFQDYFNKNCQEVEPFLEKALIDLNSSGVKVTFVDMHHTPQNMLFSRYFLYAANAVDDFNELMRVRRILFEAATWRYISELKLYDELKSRKVKMGVFELQPVYDQWSELIAKYDIKTTPTIIQQGRVEEYSVFAGTKEIEQGLKGLKTALM